MDLEIDLSVIGSKVDIHPSNTIAIDSLLINKDGVLIDRYDIRSLMQDDTLSLYFAPKHDDAVIDFYESDRYFDSDQLENLLLERYQDLLPTNNEIANTVENDSKLNELNEFDSWNQSLYKSNREEVWTRPPPIDLDTGIDEIKEGEAADSSAVEINELERDFEITEHLYTFLKHIQHKSAATNTASSTTATTEGVVDTQLPLSYIPNTRKQYNIILHTIKHIRTKGLQFEIFLKVKEARNPLFSFLDTTHIYHPLYEYIKGLDEHEFWDMLLERSSSTTAMTDVGASDGKLTLALHVCIQYICVIHIVSVQCLQW